MTNNTISDTKRFMQYVSYTLANASVNTDPKHLWTVLMNAQSSIHSHLTALETEMKTHD